MRDQDAAGGVGRVKLGGGAIFIICLARPP